MLIGHITGRLPYNRGFTARLSGISDRKAAAKLSRKRAVLKIGKQSYDGTVSGTHGTSGEIIIQFTQKFGCIIGKPVRIEE